MALLKHVKLLSPLCLVLKAGEHKHFRVPFRVLSTAASTPRPSHSPLPSTLVAQNAPFSQVSIPSPLHLEHSPALPLPPLPTHTLPTPVCAPGTSITVPGHTLFSEWWEGPSVCQSVYMEGFMRQKLGLSIPTPAPAALQDTAVTFKDELS